MCVCSHMDPSQAGSKPKRHVDEEMTSRGCAPGTLRARKALHLDVGLLPPPAQLSRKSWISQGASEMTAESSVVLRDHPAHSERKLPHERTSIPTSFRKMEEAVPIHDLRLMLSLRVFQVFPSNFPPPTIPTVDWAAVARGR